jgi:thioesterase domain-containing protein
VEGLARSLDSTDPADALGVLIPLRSTGSRPPVFCVHPAGGLSWSYAGLLRNLSDRAVYGLQARGFAEGEPPAASVTDMVADYVEQIDRVQPDGPCHLLGWSFGGNLAHAVAGRLREQGREVALLALLDSYPAVDQPGQAEPGLPDLLRGLLEAAGRDRDFPSNIPLEIADVLPLLRDGGGLLAGLTDRQLEAFVRVCHNNHRLARELVTGRFDGDVVVFVAEQGKDAEFPGAEAWRPHVGGRITEHRIACAHAELGQPGPLGEIGRLLDESLAE